MQPTINKDFTEEQRKKWNSRKGQSGKPIPMQFLKMMDGNELINITVWRMSIIERISLIFKNRLFLLFTGKPKVWLQVEKPYRVSELVRGEAGERERKVLVDVRDGTGGAGRRGAGEILKEKKLDGQPDKNNILGNLENPDTMEKFDSIVEENKPKMFDENFVVENFEKFSKENWADPPSPATNNTQGKRSDVVEETRKMRQEFIRQEARKEKRGEIERVGGGDNWERWRLRGAYGKGGIFREGVEEMKKFVEEKIQTKQVVGILAGKRWKEAFAFVPMQINGDLAMTGNGNVVIQPTREDEILEIIYKWEGPK